MNVFARSSRNELSSFERFFTTRESEWKSMNPDANRLSHSARPMTPSCSSPPPAASSPRYALCFSESRSAWWITNPASVFISSSESPLPATLSWMAS